MKKWRWVKNIEIHLNALYDDDITVDSGLTLFLEVSCEGRFTPAKVHGPPEDCYPEEFEEERWISRAWIGSWWESCGLVYSPKLVIDPDDCYWLTGYKYLEQKIAEIETLVGDEE